jgi:tetratricopeptide (TPR) repeat protein
VTPQATSELERRFGAKAAERWQHVLEHIRLSNGFSYLILLVPEASAARICAAELARHLREQGQELESREFNTPEALREHLAPWVLRETGQQHPIWAASVTSEYDPQHSEWEAAWRYAVARINERRDELIKRHQAPIIMVGAPWLKTVLREAAPDWWSVRSMVVNLKPQFVPSDRKERNLEPVIRMLENDSSDALLDPDEVLEQAELLRGVEEQEDNLAILLERAFYSLAEKERWVEAEEVSRELLKLELRLGKPILAIAGSYQNIGDSLYGQKKFKEAELMLKKAIKKQKNGKDSLNNKLNTLHSIGSIMLDQKKFKEAESVFREALETKNDNEVPLINQSVLMNDLAHSVQMQGRLEEAESTFRKALKIIKKYGGSSVRQGITMSNLAKVLQDQGKLEEAEVAFREALKLKEIGSASFVIQSITTHNLAKTLQDQGKLKEAELMFRKTLQLEEDGGDTPESLENTRYFLIDVLQKLERWKDAEILIWQTLKQTENQLEADRGFLWSSLEKVLTAQERNEEAQEAAKHLLTES